MFYLLYSSTLLFAFFSLNNINVMHTFCVWLYFFILALVVNILKVILVQSFVCISIYIYI